MPKAKTVTNRNGKPVGQHTQVIINEIRRLTSNLVQSRAALIQQMTNLGGHNIDQEAGYPTEITFDNYYRMYEREGVAKRVVSIMPTECWAVEPAVYETEKIPTRDLTPFETAWAKLYSDLSLLEKLKRVDEISGIGHYGALFLGFSGPGNMETPVAKINMETGKLERIGEPRKILYVTPLNEAQAVVREYDKNPGSIRYGHPEYYNLKFANPQRPEASDLQLKNVHWSRVIHIAEGGDVFGMPRMKPCFNYLLNIRKLLAGSAEMFWKGGFPGFAFEVPPEIAAEVELDREALEAEIGEYMSSLKRYLAVQGVTVKNLSTQIADPDSHLQVQILAICIAIETPQRIFMGSEEARLASVQDNESWNKRVQRYQNTHTTPKIVRALADRLLVVGALPPLQDKEKGYQVSWPELYSVSKKDRAEIANKISAALAQYVTSGVDKLLPPLEFLTMVLDFTPAQAEAILKAAEAQIAKEQSAGAIDEAGRDITREEELERELAEMDHEVKIANWQKWITK